MEFNLYIFIIALMIYLIGSIPFAYILTRIAGKDDIRKTGSGNVGATNVLRSGNKILALLVLLLDIFKGFIPLYLLNNFSFLEFQNIATIYVLGSFAIIGHLYPIWLRFKGGKGVATYLGFLFAFDYLLGVFFILSWLSIAFLKKFSSLASIFSLILVPIIMIFMSHKLSISLFFLIISMILILKHHSNILRLINKSETKIKF